MGHSETEWTSENVTPLELDLYRHKHHFWDTTLEVISLLLIVILRQSENSPYKNARK